MLYLFIIMILALSMMAVAMFSNDLVKKHFNKSNLKGIGLAACVIVVLLSLPMCCTVVDSGEVGIRFHKWSSNEQEDMIEKWDGKMPQIVGGNGMMLDIFKVLGKQ